MPHAVRAALRQVRLELLLLLVLPLPLAGQETFDKAEFAARRARLMERIPDGIAVVLAATEHPYPVRFRQSPDFYYLTGLEEPGAVLVLNGITKNATVFALKRPQYGFASYPPQLRDVENPQERYGIAVQPMEGFFTTFGFIGSAPGPGTSTSSSPRPTASSTPARRPRLRRADNGASALRPAAALGGGDRAAPRGVAPPDGSGPEPALWTSFAG
jgi:hypothetical protein